MRVRSRDKLRYLRHVRPSVRTYQRRSHWTDFREILYLGEGGLLWKYVEKIQIWLQFDKQLRVC